jgi:hypothetical protein
MRILKLACARGCHGKDRDMVERMTREQAEAVLEARRAMYRSFQERWPDDAPSLYVAACVGGLLDAVEHPALQSGMLALLEHHLAGTPLKIGLRQANGGAA